MKTILKSIGKWALLFALTAVGFLSFMIIVGEEDPAKPMSLSWFFTLKLIALAFLASAAYVCKFCYRKGLLPDWFNRIATEED
jgi:hypothetical protein